MAFRHLFMAPTCCGIILAGGLSSRFKGRNKAFIEIEGRRILDRIYDLFKSLFNEIMIVTNHPLDYLEWDAKIVTDIFQERSSLTGIHAGLFYAKAPYAFVTACDTPFIKQQTVETLINAIAPGFDVIIPETAEGLEPLSAIYSQKCLVSIENQLKRRQYRIQHFFKKIQLKKISEVRLRQTDPALLSFLNINTPEDLSQVLQFVRDRQEKKM
jgi:molybdopterin-guanine dinucleotide biosynthesis protein A